MQREDLIIPSGEAECRTDRKSRGNWMRSNALAGLIEQILRTRGSDR